MAWNMVKHAFSMVFGNLGSAFKATFAPIMLMIAAIFAVGFFALSGQGSLDQGAQPSMFLLLLMFPIVLFALGWMAVTWHRFILLEQYPGVVPQISGMPIWPYIGRLFLIGLIFMAVIVPVFLILGGLILGSGVVGSLLFTALLSIGLGLLWFRLALILPAAAVGEPMAISEAWRATSEHNGTLIGVVVIMAVLQLGMGIVSLAVASILPALGLLVDVAVNWVTTIVGLSILTTLYGHIVQGRPLNH